MRRSPTRMPKSRFWSAIAASVAGFLMRAAITAAPDVLAALIKNPATDAAIADQNRDFGILVGERRTWLDLVNDK